MGKEYEEMIDLVWGKVYRKGAFCRDKVFCADLLSPPELISEFELRSPYLTYDLRI